MKESNLLAGFTCDYRIVQDDVSIYKRMILLHKSLILLSDGEVQETTLTNSRAAETGGRTKFFFTFSERTVIEAELLSVLYVFMREHSYAVQSFVLLDFCDCFAIWVAAVWEPRRKVAKKNRVDCENIVAVWIIEVPLESDVIKVW